jgi:hypothetical protein
MTPVPWGGSRYEWLNRTVSAYDNRLGGDGAESHLLGGTYCLSVRYGRDPNNGGQRGRWSRCVALDLGRAHRIIILLALFWHH